MSKRIRGGGGAEWMEVVGVVGDVRYAGIDSQPGFDVYFPEGLFPQAAITLLVRANGDPLNLVADIRSRIEQIDKEAFVSDVRAPSEPPVDRHWRRGGACWRGGSDTVP